MHQFIQPQLTKCLLSKLIVDCCTQGSTQIQGCALSLLCRPHVTSQMCWSMGSPNFELFNFLFGPQWRINYSSRTLIHSTWISQGKSHLFKRVGASMSEPSSSLMFLLPDTIFHSVFPLPCFILCLAVALMMFTILIIHIFFMFIISYYSSLKTIYSVYFCDPDVYNSTAVLRAMQKLINILKKEEKWTFGFARWQTKF